MNISARELLNILLITLVYVTETMAQSDRTLNSRFDCTNIYSLTRSGMYISWNGAALSNCSMEVKSQVNFFDEICVDMQSININCGTEIHFRTYSSINKKTWNCFSSLGSAVCSSDSSPSIDIKTSNPGAFSSFRLRVYTSSSTLTDSVQSTITTVYSYAGIIVGVVIGLIVLVIVIIVAVICCCCNRRTQTRGHVVTPNQPMNVTAAAPPAYNVTTGAPPQAGYPMQQQPAVAGYPVQSQPMQNPAAGYPPPVQTTGTGLYPTAPVNQGPMGNPPEYHA